MVFNILSSCCSDALYSIYEHSAVLILSISFACFFICLQSIVLPSKSKEIILKSKVFVNQTKEKALHITQSALIIHRVVHLKRCKRGVNPFDKSSKCRIFKVFRLTEISCPSRRTVFWSFKKPLQNGKICQLIKNMLWNQWKSSASKWRKMLTIKGNQGI